MPYIPQERRGEIAKHSPIRTQGELNYAITKLLIDYLKSKGISYSTMNEILGAADGAKLEFYRRVVAPYEDQMIVKNGDVY